MLSCRFLKLPCYLSSVKERDFGTVQQWSSSWGFNSTSWAAIVGVLLNLGISKSLYKIFQSNSQYQALAVIYDTKLKQLLCNLASSSRQNSIFESGVIVYHVLRGVEVKVSSGRGHRRLFWRYWRGVVDELQETMEWSHQKTESDQHIAKTESTCLWTG